MCEAKAEAHVLRDVPKSLSVEDAFEPGEFEEEAEACDKRVDRAHNRFTKATESLEKIRALRRMTAYRERPRMLVKAEREALPRHHKDEAQPVEDAEFAVVGA